jgi:hypothetical protein
MIKLTELGAIGAKAQRSVGPQVGRRSDEASINRSAGRVWVERDKEGEKHKTSRSRTPRPKRRWTLLSRGYVGIPWRRARPPCWTSERAKWRCLPVRPLWASIRGRPSVAGKRVGGGPNPNLAFCISGARHVKTGLGGGRMGEQGRLQRMSRGAWLRFIWSGQAPRASHWPPWEPDACGAATPSPLNFDRLVRLVPALSSFRPSAWPSLRRPHLTSRVAHPNLLP